MGRGVGHGIWFQDMDVDIDMEDGLTLNMWLDWADDDPVELFYLGGLEPAARRE